MKIGVIQFPGSNCDQDCVYALQQIEGAEVETIWHKNTSVDGFDALILPGGFSYGDYLRVGAIARFSPIMPAVIQAANQGKFILGICNGFQILCEAKLLPGALVRNRDLHFICEHTHVRVENFETPFTRHALTGTVWRLPIAHGDGCYFADQNTLNGLNTNRQVLLRYCDKQGNASANANPNGSCQNIAGICNRQHNVFGLMPHPERASDLSLGCADGKEIFRSMIDSWSENGGARRREEGSKRSAS